MIGAVLKTLEWQKGASHVTTSEGSRKTSHARSSVHSPTQSPNPSSTESPDPLHLPTTVYTVARRLGVPIESLDKLDANESPYGPPPSAIAAIARLAADPTSLVGAGRYPEPLADALREGLAGYTGVAAEQIVVGNGLDEMLQLVTLAHVAPGDEVVVAEPTFGVYAHLAKRAGAHVVDVGTNDDFTVSVERVCQAMGPRTSLVQLCSPNNPTGTALPREALLAILDRAASLAQSAQSRGPLVVVDEAYYEFGALGGDPAAWSAAPLLAHERYGQHVCVLRTFSKIFGLAGLRVGYALCPPELVPALRALKSPYNVNLAGQLAARAALDDLPWLSERAKWILAERTRLAQMLAALPGVRVYPSAANFVFVELLAGPQLRETIWHGLLQRGILVRRPVGERVDSCLRITVGTPEQDDRLLSALHALLPA